MTLRPALSGRRTNLAILSVLFIAFGSGATVQALGRPSGTWLLVVHGAAGISAMLLAPPKSRVAARGLERRNRGKAVSLVLAFLSIAAIASGVLHTTGLVSEIGGFTMLWLHVATALALVPLLVWHLLARRTWLRPADLSRRNALRVGGLASAGAILWWGADLGIRAGGLPGGARRFTGSHERSSFDPQGMPVTSWIDDRAPSIAEWKLQISDSGGRRSLGLEELTALGIEEVTADLDCTSGWWSRQLWRGVRLDRLVTPGEARSILVRSATGYGRRLPAGQLESLWLATGVGGEPLSPGHGYPARLVVPDRRGFWWVKWVVSIETSASPWWLQPPYPLT